MDISGDVEAIIEQAPEWNFAGDCAILELMKRISNNMQERAERTNSLLKEFNDGVKHTEIALDNATNSLRSLQFGQQFVEYRIEEVADDDFGKPEIKNVEPQLKTSKEMAAEFLQNNFKMFRKNFEPVTIEVPDSDEEDGAVSTTTMFRAKNPYDSIPIPFIIGSKKWHEHKHCGLYDSAENSEDEHSEQFSSSSSDEKEVAVKKLAHNKPNMEARHSDSSSLESLTKPTSIESPKNVALPLPAGQVIGETSAHSKTQPRSIISSTVHPREHDIFTALRQSPPSDDPPSTSSSARSSPPIGKTTAAHMPQREQSLSSSSSSLNKEDMDSRPTPAKVADDSKTLPAATGLEVPATKTAGNNTIKRKPVNLFNDDDFNSFMTEIADKVQSKAENSNTALENSRATEKTVQTKNKSPKHIKKPLEQTVATKPTTIKQQTDKLPEQRSSEPIPNYKRTINLFDDSPPPSPPSLQTKQSVATSVTKVIFEDDLESDDFLNTFTTKPKKPVEQRPKTLLFDDDDEDDLDINNIFGKKTLLQPKINVSAKTTATALFDDDDDFTTDLFNARKTVERSEHQESKKEITKNVENSEELPLPTPRPKAVAPVITPVLDVFKKDETLKDDKKPVPTPKPHLTSKSAIFDDSEKSVNPIEHGSISKTVPETKTSLVDELEKNETLMDPEKIAGPITSEVKVKRSLESPVPIRTTNPQPIKKTSLFDDIDEDDIFGFEAPKSKIENVFDADVDSKSVSAILPVQPVEAEPLSKDTKDNKKTVGSVQENKVSSLENILKTISPVEFFQDDLNTQPTEKTIENASVVNSTETENTSIDEISTVKLTPPVTPPSPDKDRLQNTDKIEQKQTEQISNEEQENVADSLFQNLQTADKTVKTSMSSNAEEPPTDPIIDLIADKSNKKPEAITHQKPADIAAAQQIMQNYSSLFSDEPPDDSEFFQNLGNSSLSSLNVSKIFDAEQDFFEPRLPDLPDAAKSVTEPQLASNYKGVRLFSDVPPDDYDDLNKVVDKIDDTLPQPTTRIHTIFYDDFSETTRASTVLPEKQSETVSIFDDESPPDIISSPVKSSDVVDRTVTYKEENIAATHEHIPPKVNKLKMPNININVQALLPGAATKSFTEVKKVLETSDASTAPSEITVLPSEQSVGERTSSKDCILQSVNKTRIRGPAQRRPSTRRGRQENYKNTLLAEADPQFTVDVLSQRQLPAVSAANEVAKHTVTAKTESHKVEPLAREQLSAVTAQQQERKKVLVTKSETQIKVPAAHIPGKSYKGFAPSKPYKSFLDSEDSDDDDELFSPANMLPNPSKSESIVKVINQDSTKAQNEQPPNPSKTSGAIPKSAKLETIKLFDDSDDDMFGSIAASSSKAKANTVAPSKASLKKTSLFSSDDDEDHKEINDNFLQSQKQTAAKIKLPVKTSQSLFSDDDDDDDLFGGSGAAKPAKPYAKLPETRKVPQTTESNNNLGATASNNPLADLLEP